MNDTIAQLIALAGYGSEFLVKSPYTEPPELSETNSTFQRAHSVTFLSGGGGLAIRDVSKGTREWFSRLRTHGCNRISLEILASELERTDTTTLGWHSGEGEVPWAIRTIQPSTITSWLPRWMSIREFRKGVADGRIWDITYSPRPGRPGAIEGVGLEKAISELKESLREGIGFSSTSKLRSWSSVFEKALQNLSSDRPEFPCHNDILPQASYSLQTRQLLASALQACVFGGMGWWNDIGFHNPLTTRKYNTVSRRLYGSILTALAVGVNQPLLPGNSPA